MQNISFNDVPTVLMDLSRKIDLLLNRASEPEQISENRLFTIEELIEYLPEKPARQTVYGWVNSRLIPFEKFSKRLYFRKSSIDAWVSNGRQTK